MKAAILEEIGKPLRVKTLDDRTFPYEDWHCQFGQILVRVLCAGICGAQLQEIDGKKGDPKHLPHLLGHEGCGIVEDIGPGIDRIRRGDKVVLHWRKRSRTGYDAFGIGEDVCNSGFCIDSGDGCQLIKAGPCTTFSEYTIVSENRVTPTPYDVPSDLACLFGCCLSTALATIENIARIKSGERALIVGCGGVGLAMILASKVAGAIQIVATDSEQSKSKLAHDIGATGFIPAYVEDYYFGPDRFDVIIDTAGVITRANLLAKGGRYIMVGQPLPEMTLQPFTAGWIFQGNGGRVEATNGGGFNPTIDIPRYVQMWRDGKLDDYKKIITHRISLDQINEGIQLMRDGKAGRVMIEFP